MRDLTHFSPDHQTTGIAKYEIECHPPQSTLISKPRRFVAQLRLANCYVAWAPISSRTISDGLPVAWRFDLSLAWRAQAN